MAKYYPVKMTIAANTVYYTPKNAILKVERIGTNSSTPATLWIKEAKVGAIISDLAPLTKTNDNLLGPLNLGSKYYVIPRETDFKFEGSSGSVMLLEGKWIVLDKPDEVPKELAERGLTQFKDYVTYVKSVTTLGTDQPIPANGEVEIFSLTPKTIEKYIFDSYLAVNVTNATFDYGTLVLRFFYDNAYLTGLTDLPGTHRTDGLDLKYLTHPPTGSNNMEPFSLEGNAIELPGDHTLKLFVRNTRSTNVTPPSGQAISFTTYAIVKYQTS
ncbi:MAG: hypothetical protein QXG08_07975 [Candidatus Methanomethyliaceae archaeon]